MRSEYHRQVVGDLGEYLHMHRAPHDGLGITPAPPSRLKVWWWTIAASVCSIGGWLLKGLLGLIARLVFLLALVAMLACAIAGVAVVAVFLLAYLVMISLQGSLPVGDRMVSSVGAAGIRCLERIGK